MRLGRTQGTNRGVPPCGGEAGDLITFRAVPRLDGFLGDGTGKTHRRAFTSRRHKQRYPCTSDLLLPAFLRRLSRRPLPWALTWKKGPTRPLTSDRRLGLASEAPGEQFTSLHGNCRDGARVARCTRSADGLVLANGGLDDERSCRCLFNHRPSAFTPAAARRQAEGRQVTLLRQPKIERHAFRKTFTSSTHWQGGSGKRHHLCPPR